MIELVLKNKTYKLPSCWEDLTAKQFVFFLDILNDYTSGKITANLVGINLAMHVLKIKVPKHLSQKQSDQYYENLVFLGDKITFWRKVEFENPKVLDNVEPELRKQLQRTLPADLPPTPEIRVLMREKHWLEPDFLISKNIIPNLKKELHPYQFLLDNNLLTTTLTASQFSNALTISDQYAKSKDEKQLDLLCAVLYHPSKTYDISNAKQYAKLNKVDVGLKIAAHINFKGIVQYLTQKTQYAILFTSSGKGGKKPKISIGFNNNIYTLAKNGYGSTDDVEDMNLITFLDLMLKELIDYIKSMQAMETPIDKILSDTGLTLHQLKLIAP